MRYLSLSLLLLLFVPLMAPAFGADWYDSNWLKARKITIDQTDIDTADLTNYPLYVNMTLVNVGTDSQADCDDFVFVDSTNVTKLDHEIETCDDANNWAEFWVEVPTVDFDADTIIFMYYDNAGTTDQQNTQATWNSDYQAVWHLNGTFIDSTSSPITCTNSGTSATSDEYIGDSRDWDGVDDHIDCGSVAKIDDIWTAGGSFSVWINPVDDGESGFGILASKRNSGSPFGGWYAHLADELGAVTDFGFFIEGGANDGIWQTTNREIDEATWNFITITYDPTTTTNDPLFYVDGSSVSLNDDAITSYVSDASTDLCLGNYLSGTTSCASSFTFTDR